jgi:hypothetical protein
VPFLFPIDCSFNVRGPTILILLKCYITCK